MRVTNGLIHGLLQIGQRQEQCELQVQRNNTRDKVVHSVRAERLLGQYEFMDGEPRGS